MNTNKKLNTNKEKQGAKTSAASASNEIGSNDAAPAENESQDGTETGQQGTETGQQGLRWLKYAGIGARRNAQAASGLSGEEITSLGSVEAEVMATLWDIGQPATGMEVMEHSLYKRRAEGLEPAGFGTIATTLRRLTQKGLLVSEKNAQRTPVYAPTVGREEMAARVLNNVSETLLGRSLYALLPRLTGSEPQGEAASAKRARGRVTAPAAEASAPEDVAVDHLLRVLEALAEAEGREDTEKP